jgi:hypothetical protein
MGLFKRLFGKNKTKELGDKASEEAMIEEFTQEELERDDELKTNGLQNVLGKMHNLVGHALIPFEIGGAVDMYYFPNHIKGTGFATMELLNPKGIGPLENRFGTYELVAFTKCEMDVEDNPDSAFNLIERIITGIFTQIGNYSFEAILNPGETIELPQGEDEETLCLVFDLYKPDDKKFQIGSREHHLLICLHLFRSEMEFAMDNGSETLISLLKEKGVYPYSDLDREPVI